MLFHSKILSKFKTKHAKYLFFNLSVGAIEVQKT